jgi:hypothetical protein
MGIARKKDLWNLGYVDRNTGQWKPVPWEYMASYLLNESGMNIPMAIFCGVLAIVLYLFWAYHMWLIAKNTTTNESYKWKDFIRKVNFLKRAKAAQEHGAKKGDGSGEEWRERARKVADGASSTKTFEELAALDTKKLKNIYQRGFARNLWEVIYPPSSRFKGTKAE